MRSVICLPEDTRLNKHLAVFGNSGAMKSRCIIRPALFQGIRRGCEVAIGKLGDKEIDFIATSSGKKRYIQVTETMAALDFLLDTEA